MRLLRFRQWPILPKIMTISIVSVALMAGIVVFYFTPLVEHKMMEGKRQEVRNVVDVAFGTFLEYDALAKNGQITDQEARERVKQRIGALRYGENEYFWINDLRSVMIMHPMQPELDGKDLTDTRDPNGTYLFQEFARVAETGGAGFVDYMWPKPGESEPVPKISYVRLYEPWGWILGSGIYVDDVKKNLMRLRFYLLAGTFLFTVMTLAFANLVGSGITRPLKKVISGLQDIASGKGDATLTGRIAITSIDEIGLLSSGFNSVMESISNLNTFKKVIEEEGTAEEVCIRLGEAFKKDLGLPDCTIYMMTGGANEMIVVYPHGLTDDEIRCNREILANCDLCKSKRTGHVICSLAYPSICRQFRAAAGKEHYCLPLIFGGGTVGIVQFVFDPAGDSGNLKQNEPKVFKAEQYVREALPVIGTKLLMNALRESALGDQMTGLHNRRYLQEYAENLVAGAVRRGKKIGLIMCDLDYFKQVNDTHGHAVGDTVLKETASLIKKSVRETDIVIRFGGEEFLVLLMDINENDSMMIADKIRVNVQNNKIKLPEGSLTKTISLGISEFPSDGDTLWKCIKFADVALYQAKELGRNRSIRFVKDMWKEDQV